MFSKLNFHLLFEREKERTCIIIFVGWIWPQETQSAQYISGMKYNPITISHIHWDLVFLKGKYQYNNTIYRIKLLYLPLTENYLFHTNDHILISLQRILHHLLRMFYLYSWLKLCNFGQFLDYTIYLLYH